MSVAEEFVAELAKNRARSQRIQAAMDKEIAKREEIGIDLRKLREPQAEAMGARIFAYPAREAAADRRPFPKDAFSQPGFSRRVYATGFHGRVEKFLGFEDDSATIRKILDLGDHWKVRYEDVVEDSTSDEWLGRAVSEPGSPERDAEEREAWDAYEYSKTHREQIAEERFEYRGNDARGGFADADEKSRRQRNDNQLQLELERGAEVLGDDRHRAALRERRRFRALVEAFGQDPDAPEIQAWRKAKTYAVCNRALVAKAARDNVSLPAEVN